MVCSTEPLGYPATAAAPVVVIIVVITPVAVEHTPSASPAPIAAAPDAGLGLGTTDAARASIAFLPMQLSLAPTLPLWVVALPIAVPTAVAPSTAVRATSPPGSLPGAGPGRVLLPLPFAQVLRVSIILPTAVTVMCLRPPPCTTSPPVGSSRHLRYTHDAVAAVLH